MKSVVIRRDLEGHPVWQVDYEAFMNTVGFKTKLCKPRHTFTKGKVERLIRFVKENFLAARLFLNISDLNEQAMEWSEKHNLMYDNMRNQKLSKTIYPGSVLAYCSASRSVDAKNEARQNAIPVFMRHNIVESEVRNVV